MSLGSGQEMSEPRVGRRRAQRKESDIPRHSPSFSVPGARSSRLCWAGPSPATPSSAHHQTAGAYVAGGGPATWKAGSCPLPLCALWETGSPVPQPNPHLPRRPPGWAVALVEWEGLVFCCEWTSIEMLALSHGL